MNKTIPAQQNKLTRADIEAKLCPPRNCTPIPANWQKGFGKDAEYSIACQGNEIPVWHPVHGWTLLVWNNKEHNHMIYIYRYDVFESEKYLQP